MVLNPIKMYPGYRIGLQNNGQNRNAPNNSEHLKSEVSQMSNINLGLKTKTTDSKLQSDIYSVKNALNSVKDLKNKIDHLDTKTKKELDSSKTALGYLGIIPTFRRIGSLPDSIEDKNWERAALLTGLAAANFPGDLREMRSLGKEFWGSPEVREFMLTKKGYQAPFTFFKGTFLDGLTKKFKWLGTVDKSLYSTKLGKSIGKFLKVKESADFLDVGQGMGFGKELVGIKFEGKFLSELAGRALQRISIIGSIVMAALEIPALIKSTEVKGSFWNKTKSFAKQLCKSIGYVALVSAGIAAGGAALAVLYPVGAIAPLIGMAIGNWVGLTASRRLNKQVDKAFA